MTGAWALVLRSLVAAGGTCYFVGNTRILPLPSCDIGPATIASLTEEPDPSKVASIQRRPPVMPWNGATARFARPTIVVRSAEELQQKLEVADQERISAVARRLAAEKQRDTALQQRDALMRELARTRSRSGTTARDQDLRPGRATRLRAAAGLATTTATVSAPASEGPRAPAKLPSR